MKRLTNQREWTDDIDLSQEFGYKYIFQRLAEYENAEEQGLLVRLPCKAGDTIYTNIKIQGKYLRVKDKAKAHAVKAVFFILNGDISMGGGSISAVYSTGHSWQFNFSDIGKTVFITREAAEKSLAERNAQNG